MKRVLNFKFILILFALSGVYITVFSESGFLERLKFQKKIIQLENRIKRVKNENTRLNNLYAYYRDGGLTEQDLLRAGYIKKGGKLIFVKGKLPDHEIISKPVIEEPGQTLTLSHLRIIWMFVSTLIIIFYLIRKSGDIEAGS